MTRLVPLLLLLAAPLAFASEHLLLARGLVQPRTGTVTGPVLVHVQGDTIVSVSPADRPPPGVPVTDLGDRFLMPGLLDCHTHLCWHTHDRKNDGYVLSIVREPTAYRALQGAANARDMLDAGFTTVRDVGNAANYADTSLRMAIEDDLIPGPQVLNAGRLIAPFGGQRWVIPERRDYTQPEYFFADTRDELKKAIRENIHFGAKLIKIVVDDQPYLYSTDDIRFIVAEAADAGLRVAAHCATRRGAERAIEAGVATIEHGFGMTADTMRRCAAAGIPLVTTTFSLPVLQAMASDYKSRPEDDYAAGVATLRLAMAEGVTVAFGSDVINKVPGMDRGEATLSYLKSFQDAGVSPQDIVRAMTIHAAAAMGLEDRGELLPGKRADLIAVPGNPFADISVLQDVSFVMKAGEVYTRGTRR